MAKHSKIQGGLLGLLVGDALGVPYEFHQPQHLPGLDAIEMQPPSGYLRSHRDVPPGTWSDDGAQALVLLDSLLANDGLDLAHFTHGLRRWMYDGFYAVEGHVFGVGKQTHAAIRALEANVPPEQAGPTSEQKNGNGALMRVLPLVLWHDGDDAELVRLAMRQSLPTHGHLRSQLACAMYCLWARRVFEEVAQPWEQAESGLRRMVGGQVDADELNLVLQPHEPHGSGYVLDTLWTARFAFDSTDTYESCVRGAIAFGHDTDTTACVAGGIAGLRYGIGGIPARWLATLRGMELVTPLLKKLMQR